MIDVKWLPTLNAFLNATAAMLLLAGYLAIRRKRVRAHMRFMIGAFLVSVAFLGSYLAYHIIRQATEGVGHTRFMGTGLARPVYFTILISHLVLAIVNLPLVVITLYRALRGRFARHAAIARWTWPVWMYVSATGVIVYLMLYQLRP